MKVGIQFIKSLLVGLVVLASDLMVFIFMTEVMEINYLITNIISYALSMVVSYFLNMKFVFVNRKENNKRKEFIVFSVLSMGGVIVNELCMWVFVDCIYNNSMYLTLLCAAYTFGIVSKLLAALIVNVYNFITRKKFLEGGKNVELECEVA